MKIGKKKTVEVEVTEIRVHAKVCDAASYELVDKDGERVVYMPDGYVPSFFPGDHYGDYLILDIDLETGLVKNWKKPNQKQLEEFVRKAEGSDE